LWLRNMLFHDTVGDDLVFEPWITVRASYRLPPPCGYFATWGIPYEAERILDSGAWIIKPTITSREQLSRLIAAPHAIDEEETARTIGRLQEAVQGVLEVNVDRGPFYRCYGGSDIAEGMLALVGLGNLMLYMYDEPELLHDLARFMRDAVLAQYKQAEVAGDWGLTSSFNMAQNYCPDLPDPHANARGMQMKQLWYFTCAQPFTLVSPQQFHEFVLQYQMPIMAQFGLTSYACCEQITDKIDLLKKIPNLRRINVTPVSDVVKCAEQIGRDYIYSWKPNPAMICASFEEEQIRKEIRAGLQASRECIVDVTLKDVSSVQDDPSRLKRWVDIVRQEAEAL
jgi:hypothetical protein